MQILIWILVGLAALSVIFELLIAGVIYTVLLVRTSKKKWDRDVKLPDDEEYKEMYYESLEWGKLYEDYKREVEVKSGRFRLVGEYFDFGGEKAAIIIAGRTESLKYSYYFAEPYRKAGYNILVIDNRSHGYSDGVVCSLGYREYKDMFAWSKLLVEDLCNKAVFLHGICIGSSVALFALTNPECPDYIEGMCADGMYTRFAESFKNHMDEDKHPKFVAKSLVYMYMRIFSHANVVTDGPLWRVDKLKKPILFIHSRKDTYSTPDQAQKLYDKCGSPDKKLVWLEKGAHSRVRVNAPQKYDDTIISFVSNLK